MAFKAFNWKIMTQLNMNMTEVHNAFHAALFVFFFQVLLIIFIGKVVLGDDFSIALPSSISVLGARFLCAILMHLQVEGDLRQGIKMMKHVTNQPFDFSNPAAAFFVGFMQSLGGFFAEVACITFICSLEQAIQVIIKFVALASLAKVDDFYAGALPVDGNKIKKAAKPMVVTIHKRDWQIYHEHPERPDFKLMDQVGPGRWFARFVFKSLRAIYTSYIFYFMPYTAIILPYIVAACY